MIKFTIQPQRSELVAGHVLMDSRAVRCHLDLLRSNRNIMESILTKESLLSSLARIESPNLGTYSRYATYTMLPKRNTPPQLTKQLLYHVKFKLPFSPYASSLDARDDAL